MHTHYSRRFIYGEHFIKPGSFQITDLKYFGSGRPLQLVLELQGVLPDPVRPSPALRPAFMSPHCTMGPKFQKPQRRQTHEESKNEVVDPEPCDLLSAFQWACGSQRTRSPLVWSRKPQYWKVLRFLKIITNSAV